MGETRARASSRLDCALSCAQLWIINFHRSYIYGGKKEEEGKDEGGGGVGGGEEGRGV